ncbi:hypothetical protein DIPPA_30687 [Diplonema papillatum]|nr:hypothetical protein DIPPA_30687 [Diplonema papillatum]
MQLPGTNDENESIFPSLTWKQRIIGFACCVAVGFCISIVSWLAVVNREWVQFGIFVSVANLVSMAGSCFLMGPMKQVKKMFEDTRLEVTVILITSLVWTLIAAFWLQTAWVVILMCIIQYVALLWYGLSYVPGGRMIVKKAVKGIAT